MEVRTANYIDVTNVIIFAKSQHDKSMFNHIPFNAAAFRKSLRMLIKGGNGDALIAVSREGKIRGLLMAWHEELTWTHRRIATDIHFVAEQGGDMLLRAFKKWAQERGCTEVCMGTFRRKDEDRIEKLYNRIGFETVGRTYRMELNHIHSGNH